jgi:hypothetical protein
VIVESQHPKPLEPQKYLSTRVPPLLRVVKMLSAIHLDDYFGRVANKIDDVRPDRRLPPKPNAVQSIGRGSGSKQFVRRRPTAPAASAHGRAFELIRAKSAFSELG